VRLSNRDYVQFVIGFLQKKVLAMKKYLLTALLLLSACGTSANTVDTSTSTSTSTATTTQPPKPITVAAVGDISCSNSQRASGNYLCNDAQVADLIRSNNPDYFIPLGDLQYNTATYDLLTGVYDKTWGNLKDISLPVLGNHDYPADGFFQYFPNIPDAGYYTKTISENWFVVVLNTNDDCEIVSCDSSSEQYNWLIRTLDANQNRCAIVATHHPRFSSGVHGNGDFMKDVWQVLESRNVPLVLSGHDHNYERFNTSQVQFVVGTGGKELRGIGSVKEESAVALNDTSGALVMTINGLNLEATFFGVDGAERDNWLVQCVK
jgi:3',5'-cyclic AMP phosphodiesterase CpdA